uniref:Uncharacterized protein n=1 Tax=Sander lucioperca TaxID=283035 RepID=A0A8D0D456_SANLU
MACSPSDSELASIAPESRLASNLPDSRLASDPPDSPLAKTAPEAFAGLRQGIRLRRRPSEGIRLRRRPSEGIRLRCRPSEGIQGIRLRRRPSEGILAFCLPQTFFRPSGVDFFLFWGRPSSGPPPPSLDGFCLLIFFFVGHLGAVPWRGVLLWVVCILFL